MSLFQGTFMTSNNDLNHERFSWNALQNGVDTAKGKIIFLDFDPKRVVGRIVDVYHEETGIVCVDVELFRKEDIDLVKEMPFYVVPGGIIDKEYQDGEIKVIDKIRITNAAITVTPADTHLVPLQEKSQA